ncbi:S10 family peptidase [Silvibacterium dinghuense]|uniref:Peptidase S10 n=1 Tax=Silvibacterium dinghuense TaxID=1560006 RepID=A0A4Q1SDY3_9BACT|nr:peptidase S10 [Silvibacterium dinghuense]RXS95454.1 peptidase S10 [Silvibacterium dinghuense]GGH13297.1 peptidase S10 [Silvibacterium dinghuense]
MAKSAPLFAALLGVALTASALAADDSTPAKAPAVTADSSTDGTVTVGGQRIAYTAVAGTLTVGATEEEDAQLGADGNPLAGTQAALDAASDKDAKEKPPVARIFYVAYFKKDVAHPEDRPVTFLYNGGPGSSTVWLHMGSFGPKHVVTATDQHLPAAPYKLVDNEYSLLDTTDLVFIDMPGTGFGRLVGKDKEKAFWGIDEDGHAFARFIARFISKYNRWNSPKYLFGESYGTTRSAVVSNILENEKDIDLNGVILLSQIFNFNADIDAARMNPGIDLPFETGLPTYAATAWYHHKLPSQPAALEPFLKEVEDYAFGEYAHALALGSDLPAAEKQQVAEKLHEYTGLSVAYLLKADLRVSGGGFTKNLQDDDDLTTGRLDTRFSGPSLNPLSEESEYDPQSSAISSAYVALFNDYVRRDLKYGEGQTYLPEADFGSHEWDMKHNGNPIGVNVSGDLATAMKTNPRLKVMVNGGYYDLATPFYAAYYEDKHLPIPQALTSNIEFDWYESGHMVYVNDASLAKLHDRVAAFIRSTEVGNK